MKKLSQCLGLLFLTTVSPFTFAETREIEGVVKAVQCNRPTGFGVVDIMVKNGKTAQIYVLKVDSKELCSKKVASRFDLVSAKISNPVVLSELAFQNNIGDELIVSKITIDNDIVIDVKDSKRVEMTKYYTQIKKTEQMTDAAAVWKWFFSVRGY